MGIGAFLGALFIETNTREIWIIASVLVMVLTVSACLLLPKELEHNYRKESNIVDDFNELRLSIKNSNGVIVVMSLSLISTMMFYQILIQYWQPFSVSSFEIKPKEGWIYGSLFLLILFSQSLASYIVEKTSTKKSIISGLLLSFIAILICLAGMYYSEALLFISILVMFLANRMITISFTTEFHSHIEGSLRSTFDSIVSSGLRIILLLLFPLVGLILEYFGWLVVPALLFVSTSYSLLLTLKVHRKYALV